MKAKQWLAIVIWLLPTILILSLVAVRRQQMWDLGLWEPNDPVWGVREYQELIRKWNRAEFRPIEDWGPSDWRSVRGFDVLAAELRDEQLRDWLWRVQRLLRAHWSGDWTDLREVLFPCGTCEYRLSQYVGTKGISLILGGGRTNRLENTDGDARQLVETAWRLIVERGRVAPGQGWLTIAPSESQLWFHRVGAGMDLPPLDSPLYGPNAGISWGQSMVVPQCSGGAKLEGPQKVTAVRILVRTHQNPRRPAPWIFRWRWDDDCNVWVPHDSAVSCVRAPGPHAFF